MIATTLHSSPKTDHLQNSFQALLPRIELHARIYFRHIFCPQEKQDCIAETIALAWQWYGRLAERGQDAALFVMAMTVRAARAVRSGRRLCGQQAANDALSPRAQKRHGFTVSPLLGTRSQGGHILDEALRGNLQTPVVDQAIFRCDFPAWRSRRTERDRHLIDDMMIGERTRDVAHRYGLSPARVSQLRREFQSDWERFCGDGPGPRLAVPAGERRTVPGGSD